MNLKIKVIASEVANLTDARYFAAWGVDFMTYNIDDSSPGFIGVAGIKEIIDWVEGPKNLGYLPADTVEDNVPFLYESLELDGLLVSKNMDTEQLHDIAQKIFRVVKSDEYPSEDMLIYEFDANRDFASQVGILQKLCIENEVYIDNVRDVDQLEKLLKLVEPTGIVLRGGEEEMVGFKSYDELDEFFEYLEVE